MITLLPATVPFRISSWEYFSLLSSIHGATLTAYSTGLESSIFSFKGIVMLRGNDTFHLLTAADRDIVLPQALLML